MHITYHHSIEQPGTLSQTRESHKSILSRALAKTNVANEMTQEP